MLDIWFRPRDCELSLSVLPIASIDEMLHTLIGSFHDAVFVSGEVRAFRIGNSPLWSCGAVR
jgi:hypothetical protein